MNALFVLIMLFSNDGNLETIQQEFTSPAKCEYARKVMEQQYVNYGSGRIRVQGCFAK